MILINDDKLYEIFETFYKDILKSGCNICEFNSGMVCAGYAKCKDNGKYTYGMPIDESSKMFPNGCDDYEMSFLFYDGMYSLVSKIINGLMLEHIYNTLSGLLDDDELKEISWKIPL